MIRTQHLHSLSLSWRCTPAKCSANNTSFSKNKVRKIRIQLGHGTRTQMHFFLKETRKWPAEYTGIISKAIEKCVYSFAAASTQLLVCSKNCPPRVIQKHISIDVIYLRTTPFLHIVDNRSGCCETGVLRIRHLCGQIDILKQIQLSNHGITCSNRADQIYSHPKFLAFCEEYDIQIISAAANRLEGKANVERANRRIENYFDGRAITKRSSTLIDLVSAASFFLEHVPGPQEKLSIRATVQPCS